MSVIEILRPGDETRLEEFLRPRLESSLFLLSNSRRAGLADGGAPFEGTYFAASAEDAAGREVAIEGVAAHCWQGSLVLQAPRHLEALLDAVVGAAVRPILGLLGPARQVDRAMRRLGWPDAEIQMDELEGLYALRLGRLIVPEALRSGRLAGRRVERRDLDLAAAWRLDYHLEALGSEPSAELEAQCRGDMEGSLEGGDTWLLEDAGEPVAMTSFNAAIAEAVQVGGVWTPPERRCRGYGRAAVAASLLDARAEGVARAILFTGDDNAAAIRAYAALGFERVGDYRVVLRRPGVSKSARDSA